MAKVFISYRRSESLKDSARICDTLSNHLPAANVFKDIHAISSGDDFRTVVRKALATTDAVLVLIGPKWLNMRQGNGTRRLDDPEDYVRLEVQIALERAKDSLIIPVLLDNTAMPSETQLPDVLRPLASLDAIVIRDATHFERDMQALIDRIQAYCGEAGEIDTVTSDRTRPKRIHTDSSVN